MEYSHASFESQYFGFPPGTSGYHGQAILTSFDTMDGGASDMAFTTEDAMMESMPPSSQPQMQRFLQDGQRPLFDVMPRSQISITSNPVTTLRPTIHNHRQESPFSSQGASNYGSGPSPRADTDIWPENMPSTPEDNRLFSPPQPTIMDTFEPQSGFFLSEMGVLMGKGHSCVTMADVHPADEFFPEWDPPAAVDFHAPQRSYTFDSQTSVAVEVQATAGCLPINQSVKMSSPSCSEPVSEIKEEIPVPDSGSSVSASESTPYQSPSSRNDENLDAEVDVLYSRVNDTDEEQEQDQEQEDDDDADDDDDDEYRPDKSRTTTSTRRLGKGKRAAPTRALDKGSQKRPKTTVPSSPSARLIPASTSTSKGPFSCPDCTSAYKDEISLQTHIKKQHTRPFVCVFGWAGCTSTFASKNEWKRHVMSQDITHNYWVCDTDACAHTKTSSPAHARPGGASGRGRRSRRAAPSEGDSRSQASLLEPAGPPLARGAIFNRKDLYTQHIRRMHAPANLQKSSSKATSSSFPSSSSSSSSSSKKTSPSPARPATMTTTEDWDEQIKQLQAQAHRVRCALPTHMRCPAPRCEAEFSGEDAWDQRMEHVARHLEAAALGQEEAVVFGGPLDNSLTEWATRPDVAVVRAAGPGRWVLNNPLSRTAASGAGDGAGDGSGRGSVEGGRATTRRRGGRVGGRAGRGGQGGMEAVVSEIRVGGEVADDGEADAEGEEE